MTDTTARQAYVRPPSPIERRAEALAEMHAQHNENQILQQRCDDQERIIGRLNDRNGLLLDQLRTAQQNERIATRKLIRLAAAMKNMAMLAHEAEEIMKSAIEWEQDEAEQANATVNHASDEASQIDTSNLPVNRLTN